MAVDFASAVEAAPLAAPFLVTALVALSGAAAAWSVDPSAAFFAAGAAVVLVVSLAPVAFCSEGCFGAVGVTVVETAAATAAVDDVEPAAEFFAIGSNESFVLAALEVFVAPFALLLLLMLGPPPAVFVIRGALWTDFTCGSRRRRRVTFC